jgi:hypothetical protein
MRHFNPRKSRVKITLVIYCGISITLAPGGYAGKPDIYQNCRQNTLKFSSKYCPLVLTCLENRKLFSKVHSGRDKVFVKF